MSGYSWSDTCKFIVRNTYKGIRIGEDFRHHGLWLLDDFTNLLSVVGIALVVGEEVEGNLAATTSKARISFGAAIDTTSSTARWLMEPVQALSTVVVNFKFRNAEYLIVYSER